jgi:hypothetical protein
LILDPKDQAFATFMHVVNTMAVAKWADTAAQTLQLVHAERRKRCFGKGEEKVNGKTFQPYDGYAGHVYITAGRDKQPQIIDEKGQAVDPMNTMAVQALARKFYGGCYVNAAVKPWLQDNKHGRAVRCDLVAVQFFKDGAPFGEAAPDVSGLFGASPQAAPTFGATQPAMPAAPFGPAVEVQVPGLPSFLQ